MRTIQIIADKPELISFRCPPLSSYPIWRNKTSLQVGSGEWGTDLDTENLASILHVSKHPTWWMCHRTTVRLNSCQLQRRCSIADHDLWPACAKRKFPRGNANIKHYINRKHITGAGWKLCVSESFFWDEMFCILVLKNFHTPITVSHNSLSV